MPGNGSSRRRHKRSENREGMAALPPQARVNLIQLGGVHTTTASVSAHLCAETGHSEEKGGEAQRRGSTTSRERRSARDKPRTIESFFQDDDIPNRGRQAALGRSRQAISEG